MVAGVATLTLARAEGRTGSGNAHVIEFALCATESCLALALAEHARPTFATVDVGARVSGEGSEGGVAEGRQAGHY